MIRRLTALLAAYLRMLREITEWDDLERADQIRRRNGARYLSRGRAPGP